METLRYPTSEYYIEPITEQKIDVLRSINNVDTPTSRARIRYRLYGPPIRTPKSKSKSKKTASAAGSSKGKGAPPGQHSPRQLPSPIIPINAVMDDQQGPVPIVLGSKTDPYTDRSRAPSLRKGDDHTLCPASIMEQILRRRLNLRSLAPFNRMMNARFGFLYDGCQGQDEEVD